MWFNVQIHPESLTSSSVEASENLAEDNEQAGILYSGSQGRVFKNRLIKNTIAGLMVQIHPESQTLSHVHAEENLAESNKTGITYSSSQGKVFKNQLLNNTSDGLVVQICPDHQTPSQVDAEENLVEGNERIGIFYIGSKGRVFKNRLFKNTIAGLMVQIDPDSQTPGQVDAEENLSEDNLESGIDYLGSQGRVYKNRLLNNKLYGLRVQFDSDSQTCSQVDSEHNQFEGNGIAGIFYFSSQGRLKKNLITANKVGIGIHNRGLVVDVQNPTTVLTDNFIAANEEAVEFIKAIPSLEGNLLCLNEQMFAPASVNCPVGGRDNILHDNGLAFIHQKPQAGFKPTPRALSTTIFNNCKTTTANLSPRRLWVVVMTHTFAPRCKCLNRQRKG